MSAEANKTIVRKWFDAVNRGDEAAILALLADDFLFESMMVRPEWMHYRWDRQQCAAAPGGMSKIMKTPIRMEIVDMIGEGDKISVEAATDSVMQSGKRYNNAYHFAIIVRDGLIRQIREYSCSFLAQDCFGEYNPSQAESTAA